MNKRTIDIDIGRVPPQAVELEQLVLGAIILEEEACLKILNLLKPKYFYKEVHQHIFSGCKSLQQKEIPIDMVLLSEELKRLGYLEQVGGAYYIGQLCSRIGSTNNVEYHAAIIIQKYMQRELIRITYDAHKKGFNDALDIFDYIPSLVNELQSLEGLIKANSKHKLSAKDLVFNFDDKDEDIEQVYKVRDIGLAKFDKEITISNNKIILIGGAAGHGKTKLTQFIQFRLHELYDDIATYWVTLEDSANDNLNVYLSSKINVKAKDIKQRRFNNVSYEIIKPHYNKFKSFDIEFIERSAKIDVIGNDFIKFCNDRPNKFNILVIDNVLSLSDRDDFKNNDNSMYDYVMNKVLSIRQETKALVIIIHHYKDAQQHESKIEKAYRPQLTDLKGTESFRRVANQVLLINNPGKYDDLVAEYPDHKEIFKHLFIVDTGKNREGETEDETALIRLWADLGYNKFKEIE